MLLLAFGLVTLAVGIFFAVAGSDRYFVGWAIVPGVLTIIGAIQWKGTVSKGLALVGAGAAGFWWFAFLWYVLYGSS